MNFRKEYPTNIGTIDTKNVKLKWYQSKQMRQTAEQKQIAS